MWALVWLELQSHRNRYRHGSGSIKADADNTRSVGDEVERKSEGEQERSGTPHAHKAQNQKTHTKGAPVVVDDTLDALGVSTGVAVGVLEGAAVPEELSLALESLDAEADTLVEEDVDSNSQSPGNH